MKRAFASVAGLLGLAALGRWLAKRRQPASSVTTPEAAPADAPPVEAVAAESVPEDAGPEEGVPDDAGPADAATVDPGAADPAAELRRKLADAREAEPETAAAQQPEGETLDDRRARVHAKAREAIDSMGSDPTGEGGSPS